MTPITSNILDPIHSGLPPQIWNDPESDEPTLKPHVADFIKHTIYHALEMNGYARPKDWLHLVLTGSLTTFQWSPESDCDISLFVDSEVFPEWSRAEMIGIMIDHCDGIKVPGSPYVLQDYVVPAHIKPADLYRPGLRSGWDIDQQRWITPPERGRVHDVQAQENGFYVYALEQADKMERLLRYEPEKAKAFWHQIHERRRRDMAAGKGDFAESNIVYKFLANRGLFPQISEATGEYLASTHDDLRPLDPDSPGLDIESELPLGLDGDGFGYSPMSEEPLDQPLKLYLVQPPKHHQATTLPKSKIPIGQMTPEQLAEYKAAQEYARVGSLKWLQDNPRSPENIVAHWDQTTPEHRDQGMSWYQDAHNAAQQIARDRGITVNQAAGLIANYSPQQHWATNLEMASRAAAGEVIGGPKQPGRRGFMASRSQADVAARILAGEDYHDIFRGKKITSFGHLIEHGQDTDPAHPAVVVDRHALGVAHGGYADDGVYTHSKVSGGVRKDGSSPVYDNVADMYRQAADMINARGGYNGVPIQPHQLQAATWLTRQRLNAEGGYSDNNANVANRTRKVAEASVNNWNAYAAENHPGLVGKTPGTGFSAQTGAGWGAEPTTPAAEPVMDQTFGIAASYEPLWHWADTQLPTVPMEPGGELVQPPTPPIRPEELSSPTAIERGHSRPVSMEEWNQLATEGRRRYEAMASQADGTQGLDSNWPGLVEHSWQSVQQPWGGTTINAATGVPLQGNEDLYALTAKEPGMDTVSIPINASREHFDAAMAEARKRFGHLLERANHHLGVFRDEDVKRLDFDPVLVTPDHNDVETIGAHTRNIGGAYHFASGDGFWPPHVPSHLASGLWGEGRQYETYPQFRAANRTELAPLWTPEGEYDAWNL